MGRHAPDHGQSFVRGAAVVFSGLVDGEGGFSIQNAGLKEKLLAALRGGIKTVLIPEENAKDLVEISESIKKGLEIVPVSRMDEVLARAMTRKPVPIEWYETTTTAAALPEEARSRERGKRLR